MNKYPYRTLLLIIMALLVLLAPSFSCSQENPANSAVKNPNESIKTDKAPDSSSRPETPFLGKDGAQSESTGKTETDEPVRQAWDPASILTTILLALTLLSSLVCLYLLYFRPEPPSLDHGRIAELVRSSLEGNLIRKKDLDKLLKELVESLAEAQAKIGAEATKPLESSLARLQAGVEELKQMLPNIPQTKADAIESAQLLDLTEILSALKKLEAGQTEIQDYLSRPQPPVPEILPPLAPIAPPPEPTPSEKIQAITARLIDKFEDWLRTASHQNPFEAIENFEGDIYIALAPKRSSLWSNYSIMDGSIKADDFFEVHYDKGIKPGTITRVERPAIIIKKSYGQIESSQKGMVRVLINDSPNMG